MDFPFKAFLAMLDSQPDKLVWLLCYYILSNWLLNEKLLLKLFKDLSQNGFYDLLLRRFTFISDCKRLPLATSVYSTRLWRLKSWEFSRENLRKTFCQLYKSILQKNSWLNASTMNWEFYHKLGPKGLFQQDLRLSR